MLELRSRRLSLVALDEVNLRLSIHDPAQMERNLGLCPEAAMPELGIRAALREMLSGVLCDPDNHLWYTSWQIVNREAGQVVGGLCFKGPPDAEGAVEVGYGLSPQHRGHGYMSEALRTIVGWALEQPHVETVVAETEQWNEASQRVLQSLGFARYREAGSSIWWRLRRATWHCRKQGTSADQ